MVAATAMHVSASTPARRARLATGIRQRGLAHRQQRRSQLLAPLAAVADKPGGGAGLLERPGFSTIGPDGLPLADSSGSKQGADGSRGLGGGSWRVLLIDSESHTEQRVVQAITSVVGTDEAHALNVFHTARSIGQAIITCAPKEHAEFYAQQLWQRGCKVSMEPDTTTV